MAGTALFVEVLFTAQNAPDMFPCHTAQARPELDVLSSWPGGVCSRMERSRVTT